MDFVQNYFIGLATGNELAGFHAPGKVPLAVEVFPDPRRFASVAFLGKDARWTLKTT